MNKTSLERKKGAMQVRSFLLFLLCGLLSGPASAALCHVVTAAQGAGDGSSWVDAYPQLYEALADPSCTEIWVARSSEFGGGYKPGPGTDKTQTFQLKNGVAIYGGFAGTETSRWQRDWEANPTVLWGVIGDVGSFYHVVTGSNTDATAVLDGFTIKNGIADGFGAANKDGGGIYIASGSPTLANLLITENSAIAYGGGMYVTGLSSPTLTNVRFANNSAGLGAGMCNDNGSTPTLNNVSFIGHAADYGGSMCNLDSSPVLVDVLFSNSTATFFGGAMYNVGSDPTLTNVIFTNSRAGSSYNGGGMFNDASSPTLTNVRFSGNTASAGAGMANSNGSAPTLVNVTFNGNRAGTAGGGMLNGQSSPSLTNVIMWDNQANGGTNFSGASIHNEFNSNPTIAHSLIENCYPVPSFWVNSCGINGGSNLVDADPHFIAPVDPATAPNAAGDLRLMFGSPAIDKGDNSANSSSLDLAGNPRIYNDVIDLGGYEFSGIDCPASGVVHVSQQATQSPDGLSWESAFDDLQDALNYNGPCEIWVAAGVYKPVTPSNTGSVTLAERDASFEIKNAVSIYGGFAGTETARAQRDPESHLTVLSGDIDNNDTSDGNGVVVSADDIVGPNSFSVIVGGVGGSNPLSTAILDGFTITAGRANGAQGIHRAGGGMRIRGSATLTGLHFRGNFADAGGGLVEASALGPGLTLTRVSFSGNSAGTVGGGMATFDSNPTLINVSFSGNSALGEGGGFYNSTGTPTLTNVSFSGNSAASGGGIFSEGQSPVISNSIFWNNRDATGTGTPRASIDNRSGSNPQISHSLVQGCNPGGVWNALCGINGGGNLGDADPLFVSTPDPLNAPTDAGNLGLLPTSPAIDLGDNTANGSSFDLAGNPRIVNGVIDLGGYEYAGRFDCPAGDIVHVGQQATQAPDGRSWASAFEDLQLALAVEGPCEIRVAAGTYKPGVLRADSFLLKDGVAIYGGFPADGGNWEDRDWDAHETILSGDIDNSGTFPGNSYHVVLGSGNDETAVLDGVTVTGGFADANGDKGEGGGMRNVSASPTITNVVFRGNYADSGGGMYNHDGSHPVLTNVLFSGNLSGGPGAGMFNSLGSSPALINVSFSGNNASEGGAIFNSDSSPTLVNVIMWNNLAGVSTGTASASIFNSGTSNPTIAHSLIANCNPGSWVNACGINGGNNLADADPLFVDPPDPSQVPVVAGDLRLRARSPAIDAGNSAVNPTALDLGGIARLFGPGIDLGAYETAYLSATLSSAGSGSGNASVQSPLPARFDPGDSVTVTAAPAASSNFTGWTGDLTATDNTLVFTINNDTALTANFVLKTFEVIATESGSGTITPDSQTVDYDGTANFTVTPDAGWSTDSVSGDSCNPILVNGGQWQAVNIVENCTVGASFAINQYTVGGEVRGLEGTGLILNLNGSETLPILADGLFTFATTLDHASPYTVTISAQPTDPLERCTLANPEGTINAADVSNIVVDCVVFPGVIFSDRFQN